MSQSSRGQYEYDRKESDDRFKDTVWPRISSEWHWFKGSKLLYNGGAVARGLDMAANADFFAVDPDGGISAIAARVQRLSGYSTFTIRSHRTNGAKTELMKMLDAKKKGNWRATYHIQGYVAPEDGELLDVFGVRIDDLYQCLNMGVEKEVQADGNRFLAIHVDDVRMKGFEVLHSEFDADGFMKRCADKHKTSRRYLPHPHSRKGE